MAEILGNAAAVIMVIFLVGISLREIMKSHANGGCGGGCAGCSGSCAGCSHNVKKETVEGYVSPFQGADRK